MRRYFTVVIIISVLFPLLTDYSRPELINEKEEYIQYLQSHPYSQTSLNPGEVSEIPKYDRPDLAMQQNYLMTFDPKTKEVPVDRLLASFEYTKSRLRASSHTSSAAPLQRQGNFKNTTSPSRPVQSFDQWQQMQDQPEPSNPFNSEFTQLGAIENVNWTEIGPDNVGGRTRALMWDPNDSEAKKVWAGGVAGGIWYNDNILDPESSWQAIDDFLANLAISAITYDPNNTQVFYMGTGEGWFNGDAVRGIGIFKSTDGGSNWSLLSSTNIDEFSYTQKIVVTSSGTVLAATRGFSSTGGIYRSTNGGDSWTRVISGRGADIEIASDGSIYASTGIFSTGDIYKSTDDGVNWTNITPTGSIQERIELAIAPSNPSIIYAVASDFTDISWFKKSTDAGVNWTDLTVPEYREQNCFENGRDFARGQAWYDLIMAVKPTDPDVVIVGGINVLKSSDGGVNTSEVSYWTGGCDAFVHADQHAITFRPGFPDQALFGHDGGVSYSEDIGSAADPSFVTRNKNYAVTQFYAVAANNEFGSGYFLGGTQDNGTQQFTDAGGTSTQEATGGDGGFCFIDQQDNSYQLTAFTNNFINYSSNGGQTFSLIVSDGLGRFINPSDYDNDAGILYSAYTENNFGRVTGINTGLPSGQTIVPVDLNGADISAIRAELHTENRILVGTDLGEVFQIDNANGTPTVSPIFSGFLLPGGTVSSIDVGLTDDIIVISISNYGVESVWYTADGGATWTNKDDASHGLPDMPVRWAMFNPKNNNEVLLATELGVWSTNSIASDNPGWEPSNENLANVRCDMLQYREADAQVVVATHGRGMFTSNVFSTDTFPPSIVALFPENAEDEARVFEDLEVQFDENLKKGAGSISIKRKSDNSIFQTIDVADEAVTIQQTSVIIQHEIFESFTGYYITIDSNAIEDLSGNKFAGIYGDSTWQFTTDDGDLPPVVDQSIEDITMYLNDQPVLINLNTIFSDPDEGDELVFEVISNSNPTLVSGTVENETLQITIIDTKLGTSSITVKALSDDLFVTTSFEVEVKVLAPLLYEQKGPASSSLASQYFPDFDAALESADDFIVPGGEVWSIFRVSVDGSISQLPIDSATVTFYGDNGGVPGSLIYESPVLNVIETFSNFNFEVLLPDTVQLGTGTYWLSVEAVKSFNPERNQWFWSAFSGVIGNDLHSQDPEQLLGGQWAATWENRNLNASFIFELSGFNTDGSIPDEAENLSLVPLTEGISISIEPGLSTSEIFVIEKRENRETNFVPIATVPFTDPEYLDTDVPSNDIIYYRVKSVGASGNSTGIVDSILSLPAPPVNLGVQVVSSSATEYSWEVIDNASQFMFDLSKDNFVTFVIQDSVIETSGISIINMESNTDYDFRVRAKNASGASLYSEVINALTLPLAPENLTVDNIEADGFNISWQSQDGAAEYGIEISDDNFISLLVDETNVSTTNFEFSTGGSNTSYDVRVRASNAQGFSDYSQNVTALTLPAAPEVLPASNITGDDFTANWQTSDGATQFLLDVSENDFNDFILEEQLVDNATSFELNDLGGKTFKYRVRAQNTSGVSEFSDEQEVGVIAGLNTLAKVELEVYPNPGAGVFNVKLSEPYEQLRINIFNINGELVYSNEPSTFTASIPLDLSELSDGMYMMMLYAREKPIGRSRIIKQ